jgi:hypothetical protein
MLKLIDYTPGSMLISLFIPGFPGGYRERDLFRDMRAFYSDIYTVVYPGTDGIGGILSPETAQKSVEEAIAQLQKMDKKILLFAYSFGTLSVIEARVSPLNVIGLFLFSPLIDLRYCLTHSFVDELAVLKDDERFCIDIASFYSLDSSFDMAWRSYCTHLSHWLELQIPIMYAIGLQDTSVRQSELVLRLQQHLVVQKKSAYSLFVCQGDHKLDSIYKTNGALHRAIGSLVGARIQNSAPNP